MSKKSRTRSRTTKPNGRVVKPVAKAKRTKWSAHRVTTHPSNGSAPESREVAPELMPIGEAMRLAEEQLGEMTIDPELAASQLRQLGDAYVNVVREQAAYNAQAERTKTAKKALESATNLLLERVKSVTHARPLPLFDQAEAEADRSDMLDAAHQPPVPEFDSDGDGRVTESL